MNKDDNIRIKWIDVAKALGIFFIYLGHLGNLAGLAYNWVFSFHVPLFFFLSGCLEGHNDKGIIKGFVYRINKIIIPYFVFGIFVIIYEAVNSGTYEYAANHFLILVKGGIRNSFYLESGLWFLTCIFSVQVIFSVVKKLKYVPLILLICVGLNILIRLLIQEPSWYYNIDSALIYLVFYCIGWISYNYLNKLFESSNKFIKVVFAIVFILAILYSGAKYFNINIFFCVFGTNKVSVLFEGIITPLVNILWIILLSKMIEDIGMLCKVGRNTLYLCGGEYIVKSFFGILLSLFGITINISGTIHAVIYAMITVLIANFIFVPFAKMIITRIQLFFGCVFTKKQNQMI